MSLFCWLGVIIIGGAVLWLLAYRHVDGELSRRLRDRTEIAPQTWINEIKYGGQGCSVAMDVLEAIAGRLHIKIGHLRPDDRFDLELAYKGPWRRLLIDDPLNGVESDLIKVFSRHGMIPPDLSQCETVGSLIESLLQNPRKSVGLEGDEHTPA